MKKVEPVDSFVERIANESLDICTYNDMDLLRREIEKRDEAIREEMRSALVCPGPHD